MACCKCCCENGSTPGECCGGVCCREPDVCCGPIGDKECCEDPRFCCGLGASQECCPEGDLCCGGDCCPPSRECCGTGENQVCCNEGQYCCDGVCSDDPCGCVDACDCPIQWRSGTVNLGTVGGCPDPPPTWTPFDGLPLVAIWTCLGDVGEGQIAGYFTADLLGVEAEAVCGGCGSGEACLVLGYVNGQESFEVQLNLVRGHCCDGECQEGSCDP